MTKTVLITGSSSGIGKATVRLFASKGWNVAATMRSPEKEQELSEIPGVRLYRLDVTDTQSIEAAVSAAIEDFGGLHAAVNNAGYSLVGPFEASDDDQVIRQFETNVFGLMRVTRAVLPHFRQQKSGTIIQVASMGGRITFPLYSLYHGTKWAVEGFSESLQHELLPHGIRIKIIEPGPIKTDFYDRSQELMRKPGLTAYDDFINRVMPAMQEAGDKGAKPEVTAGVIYKAATDGSSKLRYAGGGNAGAILTLRKLLPDGLFNGLVRKLTKA